MIEKIGHVTVLVEDRDESPRFYGEKLGFKQSQVTVFGEGMRWATV